MKKTLAMLLMSGLFITSSWADNSTTSAVPKILAAAPSIDAKAYILIDANTGQVLAENNSRKRLEPASLTKMMTAYLASNALKEGQIKADDPVRISKEAWKMGGSKMFVKVGDTVPVNDLMQGIAVASGNDSCVAMAEYIGGNEASFANMMNQTAKALGMNDTHFVDSTGLPNPNHYSTAYDLSLLARALINDFPEYYGWYKEKWFTFNNIKQMNRNRLLWRDPSVDGVKTGHTDGAGFCLVASAKRNDMRLISVLLGAPNDMARANESEALLNYGFRFYTSQKLFAANQALATPRVWFGTAKTAPLGLAKDLYVTVAKGDYKDLKATLELDAQNLRAPIQQGQTYGKVDITMNGKVLTSAPLIALQNDPKAGFLSRAGDHIAMLFTSNKTSTEIKS